jgi:murein DD-endopeptidase MepM/ murein hydrolase activator NlpD
LGGFFIWPVGGGVKTQGLHGYNGIDIGAPKGTPIYASAGGVVIVSRDSGWNGGYGEYVVIAHDNGVQTLYGHMSRVVAQAGTHVDQGDIIGYIGQTGKATGPHLHFEVRGAKNPFGP